MEIDTILRLEDEIANAEFELAIDPIEDQEIARAYLDGMRAAYEIIACS